MKGRFRKSVRLSAACAFTKTFPVLMTVLTLFPSTRLALPATALQIPQQSIEHLAARAEQLENDGKWEDAESAYREILKIDPRSIAALNRLGAVEVRRGQFSAGIRYYKQALNVNPFEFATNLNLGIAFVKRQDYASAVPLLERAARASPENFLFARRSPPREGVRTESE